MTPPFTPVLLAGMALYPVPAVMLQPALNTALLIIHRSHPDVFERMEGYAGSQILIDPIDLPYVFLLSPDGRAPKLNAARNHPTNEVDAVIRGPLLSLLDMLEGRLDGDAMFFSRGLAIEGDTEVIVALRNAVDGAEINLTADILSLFGPFAGPARAAVKTANHIAGLASRDLQTLAEALLAPSMARHDAQDARVRKISDKLGDVDKRTRKRRSKES